MTNLDTSEVDAYRRLFDRCLDQLDETLAGLPAEALTWKPFDESPWHGPAGSLGWLIAHSLSSTVYLLRRSEWQMGRISWEEVEGDEGPEEFGPANQEPGYLAARSQRVRNFVHDFLENMAPADWEHGKVHPGTGTPLSVRMDVMHALEHLSQHIGHAQLTRQLWALQAEGQ
jgi:hypothetical protein